MQPQLLLSVGSSRYKYVDVYSVNGCRFKRLNDIIPLLYFSLILELNTSSIACESNSNLE